MGSQGLEGGRRRTRMSRKEPDGFEGALHSRPLPILEGAIWNRFQCGCPGFSKGIGVTEGEFYGEGGG